MPLEPDAAWLEDVREAQPPLPARSAGRRWPPRHGNRASADGRGSPSPASSTRWRWPAIDAGADPARVLTHVQHNLAVDGAERLDPGALAAAGGDGDRGPAHRDPGQGRARRAGRRWRDGDPEAIAAAHGFEAMAAGDLEAVVDEAIAADPGAWAKFVAGDGKAMGALIGYVMAKTERQGRRQGGQRPAPAETPGGVRRRVTRVRSPAPPCRPPRRGLRDAPDRRGRARAVHAHRHHGLRRRHVVRAARTRPALLRVRPQPGRLRRWRPGRHGRGVHLRAHRSRAGHRAGRRGHVGDGPAHPSTAWRPASDDGAPARRRRRTRRAGRPPHRVGGHDLRPFRLRGGHVAELRRDP